MNDTRTVQYALCAVFEILTDSCVAGNIAQLAVIERLPDEILIEIFNFDRLVSVTPSQGRPDRPWEWHRLVHVCRRWRYIVFESSRSLGLQLFCTYGTPVKDNLDCWPALPIVMQYAQLSSPNPLPMAARDEDDIIVALQHPHRISKIELTVTTPLLERLTTLTQGPFPVLEHLELMTQAETGHILPSESFGGPFPSLRVLKLIRVAFPLLQPPLLSVENLVSLHLEDLPSSGHISPESLLIFLPKMRCLETLHLYFLSPISHPTTGRNNPTPQRRALLPALECLAFRGVSEDLEFLLSGTDAPVLKDIDVTFFNQASIFDTTQLLQFVCRTETQKSYNNAKLYCSETDISITLTRGRRRHQVGLRVQCMPLDWQLSCMAEICDKLSPIVCGVQQLDIGASFPLPSEQDDMDPLPLLELFRPFNNVKWLRLTANVENYVGYALNQETATGVLPNAKVVPPALSFPASPPFASTRPSEDVVPITRTQSHTGSIQELLCSNQTSLIRRAVRKLGLGQKVETREEKLRRYQATRESLYSSRTSSFVRRAVRKVGFGQKNVPVKVEELQPFSNFRAHLTGSTPTRYTLFGTA
jgi:F-box-like